MTLGGYIYTLQAPSAAPSARHRPSRAPHRRFVGLLCSSIQSTASSIVQHAFRRSSMPDANRNPTSDTYRRQSDHVLHSPSSSFHIRNPITLNITKRALSMGNPRYEEEDEEEEEDQANEQMGEILVSQVNLEIDYSASTIPSTSISTTILPMRWSLANALLADDPHAALEQIQRCDQAGRLELVNEHYDDDNIGRDADDASRAERKRKLNEIDQGLREAFWDSQQHTTHGERIDDYPHVVSCYTIVLVVAATFGCTCVVRELLLQSLQTSEETTVVVDIRYMNHLVLKRACLRGHFDVVTLLLADQRVGRRVIIDDLELDAIADKANTQDVVNLLLKDNRLDSISRWNLEFRLCCRAGALDVVESMLGQPHGGDPCADDNLAIRWASETGKLNVVRRLLADRRVDTSECHQSVLECAAIHGQLDIVRLVLQNDRVLHAPDSGETAWKYSCFVGDTDTVEQLLALPDIDPVANNQVVFSVAAQHNRVGVLKCLLQDGRVEPSAMGSLAMRLAFSAGSLGAIELLLLDGRADPNAQVNGRTLMANAIEQGELEMCRLLLTDHRAVVDFSENSAVCIAADKGYCEIIELLFEHGQHANENVTMDYVFAMRCRAGNTELVKHMLSDSTNNTLFHPAAALKWACLNSHVQIVCLLLDCEGVHAGIPDNVPLMIACATGCLSIVKLLLDDPTTDPAAESNRVLGIACESGNAGVVNLLLNDPRVDPSANDNESIVKATCYGHVKIAFRLLQDKRVNPGVRDSIVIQSACSLGFTQLVKVLLEDPRVNPARRENDPFESACRRGHLEIVNMLLNDPRVNPCAQSNLPLRLACANGFSSIVEALLADSRVEPSASDLSIVLERAIAGQHPEVVAIILRQSKVDPSANNNHLLQCACTVTFSVRRFGNDGGQDAHQQDQQAKQLEIVKLLLQDPRVDPADDDQQAIISACRQGRVDILCLLLPRLNAMVSTEALLVADVNGHESAVKMIVQEYPQVVMHLFRDEARDFTAVGAGESNGSICNGSIHQHAWVVGGPLQSELRQWDRRTGVTLLLALKRTQTDVVAARVSDVMRDVIGLFARF